jgi:hypothetical protein
VVFEILAAVAVTFALIVGLVGLVVSDRSRGNTDRRTH